MFIWLDKSTLKGRGFSKHPSIDPSHVSHAIDEKTYLDLKADPSKVRWAQLLSIPSSPVKLLRFVVPAGISNTLVRRLVPTLKSKTCDLLLRYDAGILSLDTHKVLTDKMHVVFCQKSVFDVVQLVPLATLPRSVKTTPHMFVTGVPNSWSVELQIK